MPKKQKSLFDFIAPFYGLYFKHQKKYYQNILRDRSGVLNSQLYQSVLDLGCGTGALCATLADSGFNVTGVDSSAEMLRIARKKALDPAISFVQTSITEPLPFPAKSFDVTISSYVAHGLNIADRKLLYAEMKRVTKEKVIFHEYNEKRKWTTDFVEWLEGGDYFYFIKNVQAELLANFQDVQVVVIDEQAVWYICKPY